MAHYYTGQGTSTSPILLLDDEDLVPSLSSKKRRRESSPAPPPPQEKLSKKARKRRRKAERLGEIQARLQQQSQSLNGAPLTSQRADALERAMAQARANPNHPDNILPAYPPIPQHSAFSPPVVSGWDEPMDMTFLPPINGPFTLTPAAPTQTPMTLVALPTPPASSSSSVTSNHPPQPQRSIPAPVSSAQTVSNPNPRPQLPSKPQPLKPDGTTKRPKARGRVLPMASDRPPPAPFPSHRSSVPPPRTPPLHTSRSLSPDLGIHIPNQQPRTVMAPQYSLELASDSSAEPGSSRPPASLGAHRSPSPQPLSTQIATDSQGALKNIGQSPPQDPASGLGTFELSNPGVQVQGVKNGKLFSAKPSIPACNPACTLILEQLPKQRRNIGWVRNWAFHALSMPLNKPQGYLTLKWLALDSKNGKALVEFTSAKFAREAWESHKLGQDLKTLPSHRLKGLPRDDLIKAFYFRIPNVVWGGEGGGVGEIEEGEVVDDTEDEPAQMLGVSSSTPSAPHISPRPLIIDASPIPTPEVPRMLEGEMIHTRDTSHYVSHPTLSAPTEDYVSKPNLSEMIPSPQGHNPVVLSSTRPLVQNHPPSSAISTSLSRSVLEPFHTTSLSSSNSIPTAPKSMHGVPTAPRGMMKHPSLTIPPASAPPQPPPLPTPPPPPLVPAVVPPPPNIARPVSISDEKIAKDDAQARKLRDLEMRIAREKAKMSMMASRQAKAAAAAAAATTPGVVAADAMPVEEPAKVESLPEEPTNNITNGQLDDLAETFLSATFGELEASVDASPNPDTTQILPSRDSSTGPKPLEISRSNSTSQEQDHAKSHVKSHLAERHQKLEKYIQETKELMSRLASSTSKEEKNELMRLMREGKKAFEEEETNNKTVQPAPRIFNIKWPEPRLGDWILHLSDDEDEEE